MTKTDIKRHLEQTSGKSFLSISDVAKTMGLGRDSVRSMLSGLDYYKTGRSKLYFIGDVAERIVERRQI